MKRNAGTAVTTGGTAACHYRYPNGGWVQIQPNYFAY
jgi:hypothetical protein